MATQRSVNQNTPAFRVIQKCGGFAETASIVGKSESWVYRWTYAKDNGGTGGSIPKAAQDALLEAASRGEVDIRPADFFDMGAA